MPVLKTYQKWISDLTALVVPSSSGSTTNNTQGQTAAAKEMLTKVKQLERKHVVAMKPNLKNLALFEQYSNPQSKSAYTKAIGLLPVNPTQELPFRSTLAIKSLFN